jgi:hypothetical protein
MLNADDPDTRISLNLLRKTVIADGKPLVLWLGAGVSVWAGLLQWKELARQLHRNFSLQSVNYPKEKAKLALQEARYPEVFQMCRRSDLGMYNSQLAELLHADSVPKRYLDFVAKIQSAGCRYLITTNADELLEQNLPSVNVLQRSNLERYVSLFQSKKSCLAKLHGSTSSIESLVFTTDDYEEIQDDANYARSLQEIFSFSSVLFLGYGLRDEYVIKLIAEQSRSKSLFGNGPHFLVTSQFETPDSSVHPIRYVVSKHADHIGAVSVLDFLEQSAKPIETLSSEEEGHEPSATSAFYITDFLPPGTHNTSQTATFANKAGEGGTFTCGLGWVPGELPSSTSPALHDLLVGLLCFDKTYLPLDSVGALFNTVGDVIFRELLRSKSLGFIHQQELAVIIFRPGQIIGNLSVVVGGGTDGPAPLSVSTIIRRHFNLKSGDEAEFDQFIELIEQEVSIVPVSALASVPAMTRNALLMPKVSSMLGFGEALLPSQAPQWLTFPTLRLAHLVQTSQVCQRLGIVATRLPFGGAALVSGAFGVGPPDAFVDQYANYVVAGLMQVNLAEYVVSNPKILLAVLRFRDTEAGIGFRTSVFASIKSEDNGEFGSAVDAGLRKTLPLGVLDNARRGFQGLMLANGIVSRTPVVWTLPSFDETCTRLWRDIARGHFLNLLKTKGATTSSPCLCESGEPAAQCCFRALKT